MDEKEAEIFSHSVRDPQGNWSDLTEQLPDRTIFIIGSVTLLQFYGLAFCSGGKK